MISHVRAPPVEPLDVNPTDQTDMKVSVRRLNILANDERRKVCPTDLRDKGGAWVHLGCAVLKSTWCRGIAIAVSISCPLLIAVMCISTPESGMVLLDPSALGSLRASVLE